MRPRTPVTRQTCRACGSPALAPVLSLGEQRIAGAFANPIEREVPLELVRCAPAAHENGCGLVQLRHTVPSDILYHSYWYRSGVNETMTRNLHGIARQAEQLAGLKPHELAVDIGCNDGTLLDGYETPNIRRLGFEPSSAAEYAVRKGHKVIRDFYAADRLAGGCAKVITSIAMFYDLEDPAAFVAEVERALAPDGVWVLELHNQPDMLQGGAFDAIVHEHLCYYSLAVIDRLLDAAGLGVVRAQRNEINGGSIRLFIRRARHQPAPEDAKILQALRVSEFEQALDTAAPYEQFAKRVHRNAEELWQLCDRLTEQGKTIHAYGASTKGNTILQFCGIGSELVPFAADRNPDKYGTTTSTGIPIISEEQSRKMAPDYYLALPWHFYDEFVARERAFLERGGRFIVPLPNVATL